MSNYWLDLEKIGSEPKKKRVPRGPMTTNPWFAGQGMKRGKVPKITDVFDNPVQRENRKLAARWTREAEEDMRAWQNVSAAESLTDLLAREIAREIDEEILCQMRSQAQCRHITH